MQLPFTPTQFFGSLEQYNLSVWPAQIIIYFAAALILYLIFKPGKNSGKIIALILALYWLWMGIMYHWTFFADINPAARLFGAVFIVQALIFIFEGAIKNRLWFSFTKNWKSIIGLFLMIFGTILYPLLGSNLGHVYPFSPTFGLPCPTTIFTFGVLLLARRVPKYALIIPLLWSLLGFTAALSMGVTEDISLLIAGLTGTGIIIFTKPTQSPQI